MLFQSLLLFIVEGGLVHIQQYSGAIIVSIVGTPWTISSSRVSGRKANTLTSILSFPFLEPTKQTITNIFPEVNYSEVISERVSFFLAQIQIIWKVYLLPRATTSTSHLHQGLPRLGCLRRSLSQQGQGPDVTYVSSWSLLLFSCSSFFSFS